MSQHVVIVMHQSHPSSAYWLAISLILPYCIDDGLNGPFRNSIPTTCICATKPQNLKTSKPQKLMCLMDAFDKLVVECAAVSAIVLKKHCILLLYDVPIVPIRGQSYELNYLSSRSVSNMPEQYRL
jgi:hypothetical protein